MSMIAFKQILSLHTGHDLTVTAENLWKRKLVCRNCNVILVEVA